ncbi:uncharacterized protein A1O5_08822 [Cladophialophora psammophila CBS 110553]|uniref:Uncharacterized protein n=1 Tax=Cladophialophora psammophila CBS 110553 TaxID=1182543 RepID=W9WJ97_9EURO|nr:uncharacterized protein A1O5_08822 [Cladophialophora psammophila CBS 110553]EXJ68207.1 hypothetical protein A1O5_08822 [Cladophialophora psammophila CBS 110553]
MSWMDSWSSPGKHAAVPPPFYLTQGEDVPYCRTCGRVIGSRKQQQKGSNTIKYCSDRCRNQKPGPVDKKVERMMVSILNAETGSGIESTAAKSKLTKGDRRIIVTCDELEEVIFGGRHDPAKTFGRKKNRATRALHGEGEWKSVDMDENHDVHSDQDGSPVEATHPRIRPKVRPPQLESDVNGSIGGEKGWAERHFETPEEYEKRLEGRQRAEEREMIRRAARRGVVFGFEVDWPHLDHQTQQAKGNLESGRDDSNTGNRPSQQRRRKCEAVMNGSVVEPSFAKGNWAIRWRE